LKNLRYIVVGQVRQYKEGSTMMEKRETTSRNSEPRQNHEGTAMQIVTDVESIMIKNQAFIGVISLMAEPQQSSQGAIDAFSRLLVRFFSFFLSGMKAAIALLNTHLGPAWRPVTTAVPQQWHMAGIPVAISNGRANGHIHPVTIYQISLI
jgi:hypothetical protein